MFWGNAFELQRKTARQLKVVRGRLRQQDREASDAIKKQLESQRSIDYL